MTALCLPVSENKTFEVDLLCSYVLTCDAWDGTYFDPRSMVCTYLVEVYKEMLLPNINAEVFQFRRKRILKMGFFFAMLQLVIPGLG